MNFKEWLDMRITEETEKRSLIKEVGLGIWINPDDKAFPFKGILHGEWADAHGLDMNEMLRSGWVRMRAMPDGSAFAETNRPAALHAIAATADELGVDKVQLFLKGREAELSKTKDGWMFGDQPLSNFFEAKKSPA
ncbi:MAG: hypothetical protein Q8K86_05045 [Candidatus Nanopelagicaceae bacterium]|nr:hypothetical protein [Candidatus Nanopelagicaceae bacterium]